MTSKNTDTQPPTALIWLATTVAVLLIATAGSVILPWAWQGVTALVDVLTLAAAEFVTAVLGIGTETAGEL